MNDRTLQFRLQGPKQFLYRPQFPHLENKYVCGVAAGEDGWTHGPAPACDTRGGHQGRLRPKVRRQPLDTSGCSWNILSLPASRRPGTQKDAGCPEPAIRAPRSAGRRREVVTQARAPGPRSREGARTASGTRSAPAPFLPEHY